VPVAVATPATPAADTPAEANPFYDDPLIKAAIETFKAKVIK